MKFRLVLSNDIVRGIDQKKVPNDLAIHCNLSFILVVLLVFSARLVKQICVGGVLE